MGRSKYKKRLVVRNAANEIDRVVADDCGVVIGSIRIHRAAQCSIVGYHLSLVIPRVHVVNTVAAGEEAVPPGRHADPLVTKPFVRVEILSK